jgi:AhpD family alkylhydroperoxidase
MTESGFFQDYDANNAPARSRPALAAAKHAFGFVPGALARWAASPALVEGFELVRKMFERSTLSHLEQEVVVLVVAYEHECELCMALHSALLTRERVPPELLSALRAGHALTEPRLDALATYTRRVLATRGKVEESDLSRFLQAGFTQEQALEVVLGAAATTLSSYANRLTRAPLDPAFAAFSWRRPS